MDKETLDELTNTTFTIWDKVQLITDNKWDRVYTIYSYTTYAGWRVNYTLWNGAVYDIYEPWQIKKYLPPDNIWLLTPQKLHESNV